jgi:hypothetical protein
MFSISMALIVSFIYGDRKLEGAGSGYVAGCGREAASFQVDSKH